MLDEYCVVCLNQQLKTGGLMLDRADVSNVPAAAETWEKVIRKLRAGAMPPPGNQGSDKDAFPGRYLADAKSRNPALYVRMALRSTPKMSCTRR
jgi:hypothetical protein